MGIKADDVHYSGLGEYNHGGAPLNDLLRFRLPERKIVDFSTSLNPLGIPPVIKERWHELIEAARDYPAVHGEGIVDFYRDKFGVSPANILAGNGSTEMIYLVPRVMQPRRVLIITPSFHDYHRASMLAGAGIIEFPLSAENKFSPVDFKILADACKLVDAVWLGNPNNPTATLFPRDMFADLAVRFPDKWFIVDEAFIQFTDGWEDNTFITVKRPPNILIVHSLTKFYSIAGLRMGAVIGHEEVISRLRDTQMPWTINGIADRVASLLNDCGGYEQDSRSYLSVERDRIFSELEKITGVIPFPSSVNFILCKWTRTKDLDDLLIYLLENGAYIRDCRNFQGLEDNYFRIGLRTSKENDLLVSLISSVG